MTTFYYPTLDMEATGGRIRQLRKEKNLSVNAVCEALNVSAQALGKWQKGVCLPSIDNLYALSRLLQTRIEDILVENCER